MFQKLLNLTCCCWGIREDIEQVFSTLTRPTHILPPLFTLHSHSMTNPQQSPFNIRIKIDTSIDLSTHSQFSVFWISFHVQKLPLTNIEFHVCFSLKFICCLIVCILFSYLLSNWQFGTKNLDSLKFCWIKSRHENLYSHFLQSSRRLFEQLS